jgi:DNA-binding beta-propeller fold protein YncE
MVSVLDASNTSTGLTWLQNVQVPGGLAAGAVGVTGPPTLTPLADGSKVYVISAATTGCNSEVDEGQVWVINTSNNTVVPASAGGCISVGGTPVAIASSSDSSKVYVAHQADSTNPDGTTARRGTTIITVANNSALFTNTNTNGTEMRNIDAPSIDPNCTSGCDLMIPVFLTSQ